MYLWRTPCRVLSSQTTNATQPFLRRPIVDTLGYRLPISQASPAIFLEAIYPFMSGSSAHFESTGKFRNRRLFFEPFLDQLPPFVFLSVNFPRHIALMCYQGGEEKVLPR